MKEQVHLIVDGMRYAGWKSVRVTRSIESLCGSFALEVSDRFGHDEVWPILEEDRCRVEIVELEFNSDGTEKGVTDRKAVLAGYIDKRSISASKEARTLSYSGRDRTGALVDCSTLLESWTHHKVNLANFVAMVAAPFGVRVSVQAGLVLEEVPKVVVTPGDSAWEAIKLAAGHQGVLLVSDGDGGIVITRSGAARATSLVEGANILSGSVDYDAASRFHHYLVATQTAGTDEGFADDATNTGDAVDEGVRRSNRLLLMQAEKGYSVGDAKARADWVARTRAAAAETITIEVQGWKQPNGELWSPNALTRVRARTLLGVDADMLISQVDQSISEQGQVTQLRLVRPDAFTPEPRKATVKARPREARGWPELIDGGIERVFGAKGVINDAFDPNVISKALHKLKGGS